MLPRPSIPRWVLALIVGLLIGAVGEWAVTGGSTSAGWALLITPLGTAALTLLAGPIGSWIPSISAKRAEERQRAREHVEGLCARVFSRLPSLTFQSDRWELQGPGVNRFGLSVTATNGTWPLWGLNWWNYAQVHLLSDPKVGPAWEQLTERTVERDRLRAEWGALYSRRLDSALTVAFDGEWASERGGTPEPPNWYEGSTIWNWTQARGRFGDFIDKDSGIAYGVIDFPDEKRFTVESRGHVLLSSNRPGARAAKLLEILNRLQTDAEIEVARKKVVDLDEELSESAAQLRGGLREFFERTEGTGKLFGRCEICP